MNILMYFDVRRQQAINFSLEEVFLEQQFKVKTR